MCLSKQEETNRITWALVHSLSARGELHVGGLPSTGRSTNIATLSESLSPTDSEEWDTIVESLTD